MPNPLKCYIKVVGNKIVESIFQEAEPLEGMPVAHVNSTLYGGGVAEILHSLVYLMNDAGIEAEWRVIKGNQDFFNVTKSFHNALQGEAVQFTERMKRTYLKTNKEFAKITHLEHYDCVVVHDPQPAACINYFEKMQPWIWRCHIDLSKPNRKVYDFLKQFIVKYDHAIISNKKFLCPLPGRCSIIYPSIDPLSPKNKELSEKQIEKQLRGHSIDMDKPIVAQISRFDKWKDPLGVLKAFEIVRKRFDCKLVLLGNLADDDPEGEIIYNQVVKEAEKLKDVHVILEYNDLLVNALQRASSVVLQKSIKEGFGLTVAEALWKKTPVIGGNTGGIPLQIINGKTGFVVSSIEECAKRMLFLLRNPKKAKEMGKAGHEHVKKHFLITRHLLDYIRLIKSLVL
ncbi:MAG: glycosyltransferase [Candidatus Diapherotrites archaeon]|nr:glycosyltransferase [Candidatus Diapherotrites archaeon]